MKKDADILRSFLTFPFLIPEQVTRLYFAEASHKHTERILYRLAGGKEENGKYEYPRYLKRQRIDMSLYPYFYSITQLGIRQLEADTPLFFGMDLPNFLQIPHFLMTNEVMIASLKLPNVLDIPTPYYLYHDLTLKHILKAAVPDAFIEFRQGNERIPFCFEIHLKTGERKLKAKINAILESVRSEYSEIFHTTAVTWVFLTPYEQSLEQMIRSTEEQLRLVGAEREADLFRFAVVPQKQIDPYDLYYNKIHRIPCSSMYGSLL